MKHLFK